jgi:hypothetical protein
MRVQVGQLVNREARDGLLVTVIRELLGEASLDGLTACGIVPIQSMAQPSSSTSTLRLVIRSGIPTRGSGPILFSVGGGQKQATLAHVYL